MVDGLSARRWPRSACGKAVTAAWLLIRRKGAPEASCRSAIPTFFVVLLVSEVPVLWKAIKDSAGVREGKDIDDDPRSSFMLKPDLSHSLDMGIWLPKEASSARALLSGWMSSAVEAGDDQRHGTYYMRSRMTLQKDWWIQKKKWHFSPQGPFSIELAIVK